MASTRRVKRPTAPLFERFTLDQLEELLAGLYSRRYLEDLEGGVQIIRPRFRRTVSRVLGQPESSLFEPELEVATS